MLIKPQNLSPQARQQIQALMRAKGWSFEKAINEIALEAVASGATSVVGRHKAEVLHLAPRSKAGEGK